MSLARVTLEVFRVPSPNLTRRAQRLVTQIPYHTRANHSVAFKLAGRDPSTDVLLTALQKENESLRSRLASTEQEFIRLTRLNEIYREELIQHRRRVCYSIFFYYEQKSF